MPILLFLHRALNLRGIVPLGLALVISLVLSACGLIGAGVATVGAVASTAIALAPLKLMFACLPEGTEIDTPTGPRPIEELRAGDLVIGYGGDPVAIQQIHGYLEDSEETDFYEISFSNGGSVDLCHMHRIAGIRAKDLTVGFPIEGGHSVSGIRIYEGVERSYDILTEDKGYRIDGIPVNSMIVEMYEAGSTGGTHSPAG